MSKNPWNVIISGRSVISRTHPFWPDSSLTVDIRGWKLTLAAKELHRSSYAIKGVKHLNGSSYINAIHGKSRKTYQSRMETIQNSPSDNGNVQATIPAEYVQNNLKVRTSLAKNTITQRLHTA